jgi:hypothetical protein
MSISKGSLKRVNEGGLAHIPAQEVEKSGIQVAFQQVPSKELEVDEDIALDPMLMESIKKWTILVPLMVYVDKLDKLRIISGRKRLAIAKELGMDLIPCQLIKGITQKQVEELRYELQTESKKDSEPSIHEEKFNLVASVQTTLPDYLL